MRHFVVTILLGFFGFVIAVISYVWGAIEANLMPELKQLSNDTINLTHLGQSKEMVLNLYDTISLVGWIFMCIMMVATIVLYYVSSHKEEYEQYQGEYRYGNEDEYFFR